VRGKRRGLDVELLEGELLLLLGVLLVVLLLVSSALGTTHFMPQPGNRMYAFKHIPCPTPARLGRLALYPKNLIPDIATQVIYRVRDGRLARRKRENSIVIINRDTLYIPLGGPRHKVKHDARIGDFKAPDRGIFR
jgi:hypothetical protein